MCVSFKKNRKIREENMPSFNFNLSVKQSEHESLIHIQQTSEYMFSREMLNATKQIFTLAFWFMQV